MITQDLAHPPIATKKEWLAGQETLLAHEKEAINSTTESALNAACP